MILRAKKFFVILLTINSYCDIISTVEQKAHYNRECAGIGRQARLRGVCL